MIKKNKEIIRFLNLLKSTFENTNFTISDQWDDASAIGFEKDNKLIYVAFYNHDDYFYECSFIDELKHSYKVYDSNNATEKQLLKVIENFFELKIGI